MVTALTAMFWSGASLLIAGALFLCVGLVTIVYLTAGLENGLPFDWGNPARTGQNVLLWVGLKAISIIVRIARPVHEMFTEASAELGELLLGQRSAKVEAAVWSRLRR